MQKSQSSNPTGVKRRSSRGSRVGREGSSSSLDGDGRRRDEHRRTIGLETKWGRRWRAKVEARRQYEKAMEKRSSSKFFFNDGDTGDPADDERAEFERLRMELTKDTLSQVATQLKAVQSAHNTPQGSRRGSQLHIDATGTSSHNLSVSDGGNNNDDGNNNEEEDSDAQLSAPVSPQAPVSPGKKTMQDLLEAQERHMKMMYEMFKKTGMHEELDVQHPVFETAEADKRASLEKQAAEQEKKDESNNKSAVQLSPQAPSTPQESTAKRSPRIQGILKASKSPFNDSDSDLEVHDVDTDSDAGAKANKRGSVASTNGGGSGSDHDTTPFFVQVCENCDEHVAYFFCKECSMYLCKEGCESGLHKPAKFRGHFRVPIVPGAKPSSYDLDADAAPRRRSSLGGRRDSNVSNSSRGSHGSPRRQRSSLGHTKVANAEVIKSRRWSTEKHGSSRKSVDKDKPKRSSKEQDRQEQEQAEEADAEEDVVAPLPKSPRPPSGDNTNRSARNRSTRSRRFSRQQRHASKKRASSGKKRGSRGSKKRTSFVKLGAFAAPRRSSGNSNNNNNNKDEDGGKKRRSSGQAKRRSSGKKEALKKEVVRRRRRGRRGASGIDWSKARASTKSLNLHVDIDSDNDPSSQSDGTMSPIVSPRAGIRSSMRRRTGRGSVRTQIQRAVENASVEDKENVDSDGTPRRVSTIAEAPEQPPQEDEPSGKDKDKDKPESDSDDDDHWQQELEKQSPPASRTPTPPRSARRKQAEAGSMKSTRSIAAAQRRSESRQQMPSSYKTPSPPKKRRSLERSGGRSSSSTKRSGSGSNRSSTKSNGRGSGRRSGSKTDNANTWSSRQRSRSQMHTRMSASERRSRLRNAEASFYFEVSDGDDDDGHHDKDEQVDEDGIVTPRSDGSSPEPLEHRRQSRAQHERNVKSRQQQSRGGRQNSRTVIPPTPPPPSGGKKPVVASASVDAMADGHQESVLEKRLMALVSDRRPDGSKSFVDGQKFPALPSPNGGEVPSLDMDKVGDDKKRRRTGSGGRKRPIPKSRSNTASNKLQKAKTARAARRRTAAGPMVTPAALRSNTARRSSSNKRTSKRASGTGSMKSSPSIPSYMRPRPGRSSIKVRKSTSGVNIRHNQDHNLDKMIPSRLRKTLRKNENAAFFFDVEEED
eukprot:TRINITY_DN66473_c7_g1_i1.p1 TRINITY_DN66473_c7_g1~~TRINITY_DN66473_c7_g1_i1.p1  ORF type:complete len:1155 (-),score=613.04 TRINITY_DN66473_c7_g1_i1:112-3576(-)